VATYDVIIRNGQVVDGTGAPAVESDVAVKDGLIAAIEPNLAGTAKEEIDARGFIVTPGFIDLHTHYDAQATWDGELNPSACHGVTTVVMGNCGVGFAPCKVADRAALIELMEGVEDIPGTALHEGIVWEWETFPEYLAALERRHYSMNVAAQVPHGALRLYAMGRRGAANEPATAQDIEMMRRIAREAMEAGAVAVSTSRVLEHQSIHGEVVPGTFASEAELRALAGAVADAGHGVFQAVPMGAVGSYVTPNSTAANLQEVELLSRVARSTGAPVVFSLLQTHEAPNAWREAMAICERARADGARIYPQVAARAPGTLSTLDAFHPFYRRKTYIEIAHLPLDERVVRMRRPQVRSAILSDPDVPTGSDTPVGRRYLTLKRTLAQLYALGAEADYEPPPSRSLGAQAGDDPAALEARAYDALLEQEGRALLFGLPMNYAAGDYSAVAEMLRNPITLSGLGDGGAHVQVICDASMPTFMLTFWVRDRKRGERLSLEFAVKKQTADNAAAYGFIDRGVLAAGMCADINVIDLKNLSLELPVVAADLPKGGKRLLQSARGYVATLVNGVITRRNDVPTGARPGRLIRGRPGAAHTLGAQRAAG
jgi:N-acyl-D-amino-acid deacylase